MPRARVRLKHQITIPAAIAEAAQIKPDDMLEVRYANGIVTLTPVTRKTRQTSLMSYAGIARGLWGESPADVEANVKADRTSWER